MSDGFVLGDRAEAELLRSGWSRIQQAGLMLPPDRRVVRGFVFAELWRPTKSGRMRKIWEDRGENLVVDEGINYIFANDIEAASNFLGLKDTGAPAAGDTMASHAGWATITPYSNATDPAYTEDASTTDEKVSNSGAPAAFNINATDEIFGAFLKTDSTKGGTAGTLVGAKDFSASVNVINGDTLNVTYEIAGSSS
jgi:hypothetical protein